MSTVLTHRQSRVERWLGLSAYAALWAFVVVAELTALLAFGPGHDALPAAAPVAEASPYTGIEPGDPVALTP